MHSDHNEAAAAFSIIARLSNFLPFIRTVGFHVHFWHIAAQGQCGGMSAIGES
jgi:hypothetical protein